MAVTLHTFPFVQGLQQSVDDRLLDAGRPRAVENLVFDKRGRLRMRQDYDALAMTVQGGGTITLRDLATLGSRLLGFGELSITENTTPTASEVIEFVGASQYGWRSSSDPTAERIRMRMSVASYPRDVGAIGSLVGGNTLPSAQDVAAGGGLVCQAINNNTSPSSVSTHIFHSASDATVHHQRFEGATLPRVVCVSTKFFLSYVESATGNVKLWRFDPAVDSSWTALTDPTVAGAAILCFDMSLSHEGTTFWIAYCRTGGTTRVHGFDSNGTETHDYAGPAVTADGITVFVEATNGGTQRQHLACVINGTGAVNLSTYTGAGVLQTNTAVFSTGALSQVGMCMNLADNQFVTLVHQVAAGILAICFNDASHGVLSSLTYPDAVLDSKALNCRTHALFGARMVEASDGSSTHLLLRVYRTTTIYMFAPVSVADRLIAKPHSAFSLPNPAHDASTGLFYWPRLIVGGQTIFNTARSLVMELAIASTDRRQAVQLGNCLYVAGGFMAVFDGRTAAEAGFLDRPNITVGAQSFNVLNGLTPLGVYQFVAVREVYDANGNRIQSAPSDVAEVTLTGANNTVSLTTSFIRTDRDEGAVSAEIPNRAPINVPYTVLYRTRNTSNGNLTFYRVEAVNASEETDDEISQNETLYTQGEREALSGPLPFLAPEPCGVLCASADRIMSGQLPSSSLIQESRNLLPFEQANWSDSIGFFRATRGRVLAVARLDERRIVWTSSEMFELDGEGVDDNGNGTIGAPRKLPSAVGLFGGKLGWRSIVEVPDGIMFQGLATQIYLLPRGGSTPVEVSEDAQDILAAFPTIVAAVYVSEASTVYFACNNSGGTDGVFLLFDFTRQAWLTEGPFGSAIQSACQHNGRIAVLRNNAVFTQRASLTPLSFIANAWRSGTLHPFELGMAGRVLSAAFYGEYQGDCALRCKFTYDDLDTETLTAEVNSVNLVQPIAVTGNPFLASSSLVASEQRVAGSPVVFEFNPERLKCECVRVDWEVDIPFPNVVATNFPETTTGATPTSVNFNLSSNRQAGDRVVVVVGFANTLSGPASAAGWTQRGSFSNATVLERILDGSEATTVTFNYLAAGAAFVNGWTIRNSHPTAAIELNAAASATNVTTQAHAPSLTPTWGTANTLWIACLALSERPAALSNVVNPPNVAPAIFRRGINAAQVSSSGSLGGQLIGGDLARRVASLTPGPWTWTDPSPSLALTIAVRPNDTIVSKGLVYHYWTLKTDGAGRTKLMKPTQQG